MSIRFCSLVENGKAWGEPCRYHGRQDYTYPAPPLWRAIWRVELSFRSLVNTSSGRSTGSSKHECSQESPGGELVSSTRQAGSPPSQLLGKLTLTLLCLDLRQHSLQQCQRLPVVLSLHFYQLRKHKNKLYPLPKASSLLQWHPFCMKALAGGGNRKDCRQPPPVTMCFSQ